MTPESLSRDLGEPVEDVHVIIAKHEVQGFERKVIAELMGLSNEDVESVASDETYKKVLLLMKVEHAKSRVSVDLTYDSLEELAVSKLYERVVHERDAEFLLKVAMMSNRATRRTKPNHVLDPSAVALRVPLTLTRRQVERFNADGTGETATEETLRIGDPRLQNPTFADVDSLLSVSAKPFMDKTVQIKAHPTQADPDPDEMLREMSGW
jgi:hypothetical protein